MEMRTSLKERLSYGGFFVGQNIIYILVMQYLMLFYTDYVGLSTAAIGTMFLITKVWDAVNDPIMGVIVDRLHPKSGKFKPWVNIAAVLLPLVTILMFIRINGSPVARLCYAYFTYILWDTMYTISDVPIFALATAMTDKVQERVKIMSIGRLAAGIAALIASLLTMPIITKLGWTKAVIILCLLALFFMVPIRFFAVERFVDKKDDTKEEASLGTILKTVCKNKYLMIFYGAFFCSSMLMVNGVVGSYFAIYALGSASYIPIIALCSMVPALVIPIILPMLIRKFGKRNILIFSSGMYVLSCVTYYFIGYNSITVVLIFAAINSMLSQTPRMMAGMVTSDCIEYGTYTTGDRAEGVAFSLQTFANKLSGAFSASIASFMLTAIGYAPNVAQSTETLSGIWKMMTVIPAVGYAAMFVIILLFYKLTDKEVQEMTDSNNKRFNDKENKYA